MILALWLVPAITGLLAFVIRKHALRRLLLVTTAMAHTVLTGAAWWWRPGPTLNGWFHLDALGIVFLEITSLLFLAAAFYAIGYLRRETAKSRMDIEEGFL
ncbi:MAG: NADH dehydrogenase FAD-containing subunit, partial [Phycisphaerales bacterium]|nr:NADH dehydrogenase FAD-containing subunit [Phycisphaerales bacterium]